MDFLEMLQNDPEAAAKMDMLLGRGGQPAPAGAPGAAQAATATPQPQGQLSQAQMWDPASQPTSHPNPDYSPYQGDPFTYGLYGGEHNFFGGPPAGAEPDPAPDPAPGPAAADPNAGAPDGWNSPWDYRMFEPVGQRTSGSWAAPTGPAPTGYVWDSSFGYYRPWDANMDGNDSGE